MPPVSASVLGEPFHDAGWRRSGRRVPAAAVPFGDLVSSTWQVVEVAGRRGGRSSRWH
jgi:hypothetical protein